MSVPADARPILVLQHIDCEPAAAYADELHDRGLPLQAVHPYAGEQLPDWRAYRAIVAMGGPMGAYDEPALPWLAGEKRLIAEAVRAGTPFWGVCLGAQLLAASLGASVTAGPQPEVGVLAVELTAAAAADPVFSSAPGTFPALQWHGDTFALPAGAVQLARSVLYEQQAFVIGRAYALQFHLEVTPALVAEWGRVPAYAGSVAQLPGEDPLGELVAEVNDAAPAAITLARALFARWLTAVVGV